MAYRPPKGVRPPQLEGKRSGRPKGSRSYARAREAIIWGFMHLGEEDAVAPSPEAEIWRAYISLLPVREWARLWEFANSNSRLMRQTMRRRSDVPRA